MLFVIKQALLSKATCSMIFTSPLVQTHGSSINHSSRDSHFGLQLLLLVTFSCHLLNLKAFHYVLEILSNKELLFKNWNCVKYMETPILFSSLSLIQTCQQRHLMLSFVSIQTTTVSHCQSIISQLQISALFCLLLRAAVDWSVSVS